MDYILFGAGTGASLAVIGWILREWGPRLRDGKSDESVIYSASELIDRMSWARFCASCGMAMVAAGTLILLATAIVVAWNPGDDLASGILIGTYVFVSLLMLVWAFLYTRQFGTSGIYRPVPVDPVSDTREAVAVTDRESSEPAGEAPAGDGSDVQSGDESPAEPAPDFAEVAARRGGLGRFASFFNRPRPAEPTADDDGDDLEDEQIDIVTEQPADETPDIPEVVEVAAITETDEGPVEVIEIVNIGESAPGAEDDTETPAVGPKGADTGIADPAASTDDVAVGDASSEASIEAPAPVATPEEEALAELRRRRLARLSGGNH